MTTRVSPLTDPDATDLTDQIERGLQGQPYRHRRARCAPRARKPPRLCRQPNTVPLDDRSITEEVVDVGALYCFTPPRRTIQPLGAMAPAAHGTDSTQLRDLGLVTSETS